MLGTTLNIPNIGEVQGAIDSTVQNLDWSSGSKDIVILLIFALSILVHILFLKKNKIFSLLFSIYTSYLVVLFFPYNLWLSHLRLDQLVWGKAGAFILLIIILTTVFIKGRLFMVSTSGIVGRVLQSIVFGILNMGLLACLLSTLLPLDFLNQFSGFTLNLFTPELAKFIWIALPLILVLLSVKLRRRGPGRPPVGY